LTEAEGMMQQGSTSATSGSLMHANAVQTP